MISAGILWLDEEEDKSQRLGSQERQPNEAEREADPLVRENICASVPEVAPKRLFARERVKGNE